MINSRDINDLRPEAREKCRQFLAIAEILGLRVFLTSTLRDCEAQRVLYERHKRDPKAPLAAPPGRSWHQFGAAWDVAFRPADNPSGATWEGDWHKMGEIAALLGIEWGGLWKSPKIDRCHFQYVSDEARSEQELWEIEQQAKCPNGNCS